MLKPSRLPGWSLFFVFDETYLEPGLVAVWTALANSPRQVNAVVATHRLSMSLKERIVALDPDRVVVVDVANEMNFLESRLAAPTLPHIVWARLLVNRFVPQETKRVLYLDADTFTRKSVERLFAIDLRGNIAAACTDERVSSHGLRGNGFCQVVGSLASSSYFNAGVVVIDMNSWREQEIENRALQIATENRDLRWMDQDVLNLALWDRWYPVPSSDWNYQPRDTMVGSAHASVVHFTGPKPWQQRLLSSELHRAYLRAAKEVGWEIRIPKLAELRARVRSLVPLGYIEHRRSVMKAPAPWEQLDP